MNNKLELAVSELALAVINKNTERAEKLVRQLPQDVLKKVADGGEDRSSAR